MKRACFVCLFQLLTTAFLLSQSNPVPVINQTANVAPPITTSPISVSQPDPKAQARILDRYGKLPLSFEANQGQADGQVKFLSRTGAYALFLTPDEAVLALRGKPANKGKGTASAVPLSAKRTRVLPPEQATHGASANRGDEATEGTANSVLRMKLRNANSAAKVNGLDELAGATNYFIGNDPTKWRTNVPTYAKVKYEGIYPGIDLVYYGNQRQLEYDFIVAPGADPHRIAFDVRGAKRIRQDAHGDLIFKMGEEEVRWHKPVVYQKKNGETQLVTARYAITDTNRVTFDLAKYDATRTLYIDPLIYSTYLGGSGEDFGTSIVVDNSGNAYLTGYTFSTDFPTKDPLQPANGGGFDAFVTKINTSGSALVYSTYLGGNNDDQVQGIVVDGEGNVYVTGFAGSTNFPTTPAAFQTVCNGGCSYGNAFVSKINSSGSALVYSTYLGGSSGAYGNAIAVDSAGNAYVTGYTAAYVTPDFPVTSGAFQSTFGGGLLDAFVVEFNPAGSALVYSTYLGGSGNDEGYGIVLDTAGNAYVTGSTQSTNFPITHGAWQTVCNGGSGCDTYGDAFVTKLNPKRSALVYSTYLGGSGADYGLSIAVDGAGNAYVTGQTASTDFPTKDPFQPNYGGNSDAFVSKLNPKGSALVYSTYLGGSEDEDGSAIAVDSAGNAYVTGQTYSTNFPVTPGAFQKACPRCGKYEQYHDAFVTKFNPTGSALFYSTYLGGNGGNAGYGIAVDSTGNAYVTGGTTSSEFPTMNPLQPVYGGDQDAFVTKIQVLASTTTTLSSSPNPSTDGQAVTFIAVVTSSAGSPPDGESVSFMKGKAVLGTGSLSGGSASFTTSTLKVGTTTVTAVYAGDSNFAGSTSKAVKQVVNNAAMPDLVSAQNPSESLTQTIEPPKLKPQQRLAPCPSTTKVFDYYGPTYVTQPVIVDSQSNMDIYCHDVYNVICDGVVSFYDWVDGRKSLLGTGSPVNGDGCGRMLVTTSLSVGTHLIEATYEDSTGIYGPSSERTTVEITTWPTTTTVTSSPDPSNYGQDVTFTVAPTSEIEDPQTGKVTIFNGTIPFGTATLNGNGVAAFTVKNLAVGTNPITAEYLGDSLSAKSTSAVLNQVVNPASTVTGITSSANPSSPGETVTFTAGVVSSTGAIPTGTVTFAAGGTTLGTVALTGRIAKISTATLPAGSTTITATYNGATDFTGSSASLTQSVRQ
jgi:hypothetical protein